jgi:DNA-binding LacI/PurR family transcriptional regulator
MDFEGVAAAAIDRLVGAGHTRLAVTIPFGGVNFGFVFEEAYRQALHRHGIEFDPELVFVTHRNEAAGYDLVNRMQAVPNPPTAVLLIYEITAIGIYRRLSETGRTPGRDLAVIGFRDEPTTRFLKPTLTCFSVSLFDLGVELATALLGRVPRTRSDFRTNTLQKLIPLSLRPGESG